MAEEGTLCINADVLKKAGANASTASTAEAYTNVYIKMAEGTISRIFRYDLVTNYSSVSATGKQDLKNAVSSFAAAMAINYDMSGFTSRQEALTMLNFNWAIWADFLNDVRKDNKYKDFIITGLGDVD